MDFSKTKKKKKKKKDLDDLVAEDEKEKAEEKENGLYLLYFGFSYRLCWKILVNNLEFVMPFKKE